MPVEVGKQYKLIGGHTSVKGKLATVESIDPSGLTVVVRVGNKSFRCRTVSLEQPGAVGQSTRGDPTLPPVRTFAQAFGQPNGRPVLDKASAMDRDMKPLMEKAHTHAQKYIQVASGNDVRARGIATSALYRGAGAVLTAFASFKAIYGAALAQPYEEQLLKIYNDALATGRPNYERQTARQFLMYRY
jgi:hypothetical protein